ncbi:angiopoietin-related protein 6-like [Branchiostoma lanceolatum]|uniref:angiopoietin-related protein 6-like n=1 Tax=Branchiostoma lanceolatum TaxID=7740 RepID=UPI0034555E22
MITQKGSRPAWFMEDTRAAGLGPTQVQANIPAGGWTVVMNRFDGSVDFALQLWDQYEQGFGDPAGEYWLGLATLHEITTQKDHYMRLELEDFDGTSSWAEWSFFQVGPASDNYRLRVAGYSGTAGDGLTGDELFYRYIAHLMPFSTADRDNDPTPNNCAQRWGGGWWYTVGCGRAYLTGSYLTECSDQANPGYSYTACRRLGVNWTYFRGSDISLKKALIMVRPTDVGKQS